MAVRITANFERNLGDIEAFLAEAGAGAAFHGLIEHLPGEIIPSFTRCGAARHSCYPFATSGNFRSISPLIGHNEDG